MPGGEAVTIGLLLRRLVAGGWSDSPGHEGTDESAPPPPPGARVLTAVHRYDGPVVLGEAGEAR